MSLSIEDQERYSRQIAVIGEHGQEQLLASKVLCIGAGGLGSSVLLYLAAAGVGTLGIVDQDLVSLSNLQRQIIFKESDIGKNKATQAGTHLKEINRNINLIIYNEFINKKNAESILQPFDIIIDCSDNFDTRYLVNAICAQLKKPLISASIFQFEGQCSVFNYKNSPCYCCLYETPPEQLQPNCGIAGVLGVLPGLLGTIQATEALKIITNQGKVLAGRVILVDALNMSTREFLLPKNPDCTCCHVAESRKQRNTHTDISTDEMTIDAPTLSHQINDVFLIDVREPSERAICHIGGTHIPLSQLPEQIDHLPKDRLIVAYCKSGNRSRQAVLTLRANGLTRVKSLRGGILAWIESIDPTLQRY